MENQMQNLQLAVDNFEQLAKDQKTYGTEKHIDAQNKCFEILNESFGWNFDHKGKEKHRDYITNATDTEIALYLKEVVIPDLQTYGVHTPQLTTELYKELKAYELKVKDLSWGNDEGDSIQVNDNCIVWVPNSNYSHWGYVPFLTSYVESDGSIYADEYDWDKQLLFKTKEQLIQFLINQK
jgi:hypothetical protein